MDYLVAYRTLKGEPAVSVLVDPPEHWKKEYAGRAAVSVELAPGEVQAIQPSEIQPHLNPKLESFGLGAAIDAWRAARGSAAA